MEKKQNGVRVKETKVVIRETLVGILWITTSNTKAPHD